jgi:hypothetical protein
MELIRIIFFSLPLSGSWGTFFEWVPMLLCAFLFYTALGALKGASRGAMLAGEPPPGCPFGYLALAAIFLYGYGFLMALF